MKAYLPIILLLVALLGAIYFMIDSQPKKFVIKQTFPFKFENTPKTDSLRDQKQSRIHLGRTLFANYCAACHHKNMRDDLTGPALYNFTDNWQNDTIEIMRYLNNPQQYFMDRPSKRMVDLHKKYGYTQKPKMSELTVEELKALIEFIEISPTFI